MRLCRFERNSKVTVGLYDETYVVPLHEAGRAYESKTGEAAPLPDSENVLDFLPPDGPAATSAKRIAEWRESAGDSLPAELLCPTEGVKLLLPVPRPNKAFFLAGNYAAHIEEGNMTAVERAETFPWVFMKPPTTTLTHPGEPVRLPEVSPDTIDYELELAVVIGRHAKGVAESEALKHVAGYTIINDISDRRFLPNPKRRTREKDAFFDWMHGKWHDGFCPCGPCVTSRDAIPDPQTLNMQLRVNGELRQDASTAQQVFPVAAVIEFISSFVTLEPGDIISTGTPSGVGAAKGLYLGRGDQVDARISSIGRLVTGIS
jgi:2-keto-4-pentenoate hydratase/2-oxohepta-3-ene-1,7-dioic acid hydratase in catechol pathway